MPLGLTLYALWLLYRLAYAWFGPDTAFARLTQRVLGRYIPGMELLITLLVVLLVGAVVRHWLGRRILRGLERLVLSLPVIRKLYWGTRQLAHITLGQEEVPGAARRIVVLVEFPYPGSYVLGMVTSETADAFRLPIPPGMALVYIPTAPNPLSGWLLFVPQDKLIPVDLTVDEGISLILSGGLVAPSPRPRPVAEGKAEEARSK